MTDQLASTVALSRLFADRAVNARRTDAMEALDEMIASVAAIGVLEPLLCRPAPQDGTGEGLLVVDGERRRKALCALAERGEIEADAPVLVVVRDMSDDEAREASLAANIVRLALHPVDQFEAFSAQAEAGRTPPEIAARFGVAERVVRQRIALGALHPDIRAAWRAGRIGADAAQAFTLARDPMVQRAKYLALEKEQRLFAHHIRAALGANHSVGGALRFVGLEAYRAAGGEAVEDLFGGAGALSDPGLAQRLANDKLKAECARLVKEEGWSFALPRGEAKNPWSWTKLKPTGKTVLSEAETAEKGKLETIVALIAHEDDKTEEIDALCAKLRPPIEGDELDDAHNIVSERLEAIEAAAHRDAFGPRQKKQSGCLLDITDAGALQVTYGLQKPEAAGKPAKGKTAADRAGTDPCDDEDDRGDATARAAPEEAVPLIPATLCLALSQQRTIAAAKALAADPELALCVAIAALQSHNASTSGVKLTANGYYPAMQAVRGGEAAAGRFEKFSARIAMLEGLDTPERLQRLAVEVAGALDLQRFRADDFSSAGDALIEALDREDYEREALAVFDADAYFKAVSTPLCNRAADELALPAKGRPKKKADLAAALAAKAIAERWLPAELRHPAATAKQPTLAEAMADALAKADAGKEAAE